MAWDIRSYFRSAGIVAWLVGVNVAVFVLLRIVMAMGGDAVLAYVELPARWDVLLSRPWTLLTYMVAHTDGWHLIINMVWLWCFGRFLADVITPRRFVGLYISGGVAGALLFLITWPLHASGLWLTGASASVVAIVAATAIRMPAIEVNLMLIGPIRLMWVAWITIALDLTGLFGPHPGSAIAHLGGLAAGAAWALLATRRKKVSPSIPSRQRLDELLDKVRRSGFASLSLDERRELMRLSQNLDN